MDFASSAILSLVMSIIGGLFVLWKGPVIVEWASKIPNRYSRTINMMSLRRAARGTAQSTGSLVAASLIVSSGFMTLIYAAFGLWFFGGGADVSHSLFECKPTSISMTENFRPLAIFWLVILAAIGVFVSVRGWLMLSTVHLSSKYAKTLSVARDCVMMKGRMEAYTAYSDLEDNIHTEDDLINFLALLDLLLGDNVPMCVKSMAYSVLGPARQEELADRTATTHRKDSLDK